MDKLPRAIFLSSLVFAECIGLFVPSSAANQPEFKTTVSRGTHPWYEVKVDPENGQNIIICGTKLDTAADALFGFVYVSTNGGKNWHIALEDRNSLWVSEQSCAFGPHHRAYFISEASKVINGNPQHEQGTTRLYVSTDGGQNWEETTRTGWADYSTSVVNTKSGELYTFFNTIAGDQGRTWGSNVGVLVFSSDGKRVDGPFFDSALQDLDYDGTFPSGAVFLNSGTVATLYYAMKGSTTNTEADLGILRVRPSQKPSLEHTPILHTVLVRDCLKPDTSLTYDQRSNKLFLVYVQGCKDRRHVTLLTSEDEGKTWKDMVVLGSYAAADNPSLVLASNGSLSVLWEEGEGSGRWLFSTIQNQKLIEPASELSLLQETSHANDDSLLTWVYQANEHHSGRLAEASIMVNVVNMLNIVWRAAGAVLVGDNILVVWASGDYNGTQLYSALLKPEEVLYPSRRVPVLARESDVTEETVMLYGGAEHFDSTRGNLDVCLKLGNRGNRILRAPIRLEATDVSSPIGTITITNATNGQSGVGAIWDISDALTGIELPPRDTSNTFCLSFRLMISSANPHVLERGDLLLLKLKVMATASGERVSTGSEMLR